MNHLVIAVSKDSSLELLRKHADVIVLDKELPPTSLRIYESVYIRSHFSTPALMPQNFRDEIEKLVNLSRLENPRLRFIDNMSTVDEIVAFEDKWNQYEKFSDFMPLTKVLHSTEDASGFTRPIFKKRLSSRGAGVTWDSNEVTGVLGDWIIQESLNIVEEKRVYVINGKVYPVGALRRSMTDEQKTHAVDSCKLSMDETVFAANIAKKTPELDMIGLDIARTADDKLFLIEVNRSPGFGAFEKLTGANLADILYRESV